MASNSGVQQQQQQQQHFQQQQQNSSPHQCKECGVYFNSAESLEVHLRYHKENLLNKWATQAAAASHSSEETNNNNNSSNSTSVAKTNIKREFIPNTIAAAADSSDSNMKKSPEYGNRSTPEANVGFGHPPTPQSYHSASSPYQNPDNTSFSPGFQNYQQIKQERASPQHFQQSYPGYSDNQFFSMDPNAQTQSLPYTQDYPIHKMPTQNSAFRYHPYQQHGYERNSQVSSSSPAYPPQPTPSPSPKQCDKCGYVCESASQLIEHLNVAHPPTPAPHLTPYQQNQQQHFMFGQNEIKVEVDDAQSEILDLDSHKVHQVYSEEEKRQNGEMNGHNPHSVSAMLNQWPQQQQQKVFAQDQRMFMGGPDQKLYQNNMPEGNKLFTQDQKLFQPHQVHSTEFLQNGVTTTSQDSAGNLNQQPYRPFDHMPQASAPVISSTQVSGVAQPATAAPTSVKGSNWKSNEARRPKTYNCTACNKWFTSSGHLKRHYNTTLHKNAVKSSGQPDPATLPISAHHHPARDSANRDDQSSNSPNEDSRGEEAMNQSFERPPSMPGLLQQPPNGPYDRQPAPNIHHPPLHSPMGHAPVPPSLTNLSGSPPNGEAGPSATNIDSRGLLSLSTTPSTSPHGFNMAPMMPMVENNQFQMYPNASAPHVTHLTATSSLNTTGENPEYIAPDIQPLPSFAQFQAHRYGLLLGYGNANVGGAGPVTAPFSYYSDPYDTPESRALIFRQEEDYKLTVLTVSDPSIEGDPYSPPHHNNNNNLAEISATDGDLKINSSLDFKYEAEPASPEKAHIKRDYEECTGSPQISSTVKAVKQQGLHKCFDCDKTFNKSCYLTQHNKTFHSGDKPFKCIRCGKRFSCETQYQEHHSKHAGEKPHKCDLCPKQFNHKTDLRRHMCLHTGQKPYACDTCGKGFIRKDHMLKHCETHMKKSHSKIATVR